MSALTEVKNSLKKLYEGRSRRSQYFNMITVSFDLVIVLYFISTTFYHRTFTLVVIDSVLGVALFLDYLARLWIADRKIRHFLKPLNLIDLLVIATLIMPAITHSLAFLRIVRAFRVLYIYRIVNVLVRSSAKVRQRIEIIWASLNLLAFLFIITSLVYITQAPVNDEIKNFLDALYYTVTTLTTTGYGDITLNGVSGRILSILLMIIGLSLFLRLIQTIFLPAKVLYSCPSCGLRRHDPDALHCKHCGILLKVAH